MIRKEHNLPDATQIEGHATELAALRRMIQASRGTCSFSVAVCNGPALRDEIIEQLCGEDSGIQVLSTPSGSTDPFALAKSMPGRASLSALFLIGMEDSLDSDDASHAILGNLNASRELWSQEFTCPIVFWLPQYAATLLSINARDLWAWCSHQFEFESESAGRTPAASASFGGDLLLASNLGAEQKQFRMGELRKRIDDAGDPPADDLAGYVVSWINELAFLHYSTGDLTQAEAMHRKALEINQKLGRLDGIAIQYGNLGLIHRARGDLDQAEAMLRKALEIDEKLGWLEGMAHQYGNLGVIHRERSDLDQAEIMHHKALEINQKLGRLEGMAKQYGNLGVIYQKRGDLDQAETMHREALEIDVKLGHLEAMAGEYSSLGLIYAKRGDLDQAEATLRKSLAIDEKLGRLEGMANQHGNLGHVFEQRGDLDAARQHWTQARDFFGEIGMPHKVEQVQASLDELND